MDLQIEFNKVNRELQETKKEVKSLNSLVKELLTKINSIKSDNSKSPRLMSVQAAAKKYNIHPNTLRICYSEDDPRLQRYGGEGRGADAWIDETQLVSAIERGLIRGTIPA